MFDKNNLIDIFRKRKWLIIVSVIIILTIITVILFQPAAPTQIEEIATPQDQPVISPYTGPWPTETAKEIKAIEEQTKADEKYANWERATVATYPWINRIPIRSDSYFAYFELERGRFMGLLYPQEGEDPEQIKKEVIRVLKEEKEIPADKFPFKWQVFPPNE